MSDLTIEEQLLSEQRAILTASGRLNALTAHELKARLKELVAEKRIHILVDLTDISFIDSSGLAALISGLKAARQDDGNLELTGLNERTISVFKLTLLDRVFTIHHDREAVLKTWD